MVNQDILTAAQERALLFLDAAGTIEGKTKFQKLMFLGDQEHSLNSGFNYVKYNYGPYSFELSQVLGVLEALGIIVAETVTFQVNGPYDGKKITYSLTDKGGVFVQELKQRHADFIVHAKEVLTKWNSVPSSEIVKYVYAKYM